MEEFRNSLGAIAQIDTERPHWQSYQKVLQEQGKDYLDRQMRQAQFNRKMAQIQKK